MTANEAECDNQFCGCRQRFSREIEAPMRTKSAMWFTYSKSKTQRGYDHNNTDKATYNVEYGR